MSTTHLLLLECADDRVDDDLLIARMAALGERSGLALAAIRVCRALRVPEVYAYLQPAGGTEPTREDARRIEAAARGMPAFAECAPTVDRLERMLDCAGASRGAAAPFHYVVETDPADGWRDELFLWYDSEHMPGLAAVPGCARAQRLVNHDRGPQSFACYDLVDPQVTESPPWLAVRHTAWSERVRPHFRNTKRTMFRVLPGPQGAMPAS